MLVHRIQYGQHSTVKKKQISILHQYLNNFLKELFYATMTDNIAQDLSSDINHNEDL